MKRFILLIIACLFLSSCEYFQLMNYKEWLEKSKKEAALYACGATGGGGQVYWKNGNRPVYLEDGNGGSALATSIYVYENDVYVAGRDTAGYACFWKNGKKVRLNTSNNATSNAISVSEGVVFNAVVENSIAFLYINNEGYELIRPPSVTISNPKSIFVESNGGGSVNIIIGGFFRDSGANYHPCYWTGGGSEIVDLGFSGATDQINSVFLYKGQIYSAGVFNNIGYIWVDNSIKYNIGNTYYSVYVKDNNIYYTDGSVYYINSNSYALPDFNAPGNSAIKTFNNDIYVSGSAIGGGLACYWKNGSGPFLFNDDGSGSTTIGQYSSIFVTWDNQ